MLVKKGFHSQLNSRGYRLTQQRQAILNELQQADHHLTAREVYAAVRRYLLFAVARCSKSIVVYIKPASGQTEKKTA